MSGKFTGSLRHLPQSPRELQEALMTAFPSFATAVANEAEEAGDLGEITFHGVVMDFAPFFARATDTWTDRQLQWLGELVVASMDEGSSLGNAWDTCFLEHSRQLKVKRRLAPWLARARAKRPS
jgi:hypothetical protein